jgi:TonB family protein
MRLPWLILFVTVVALMGQESTTPSDARGWINQGVRDYKSARYAEAVEAFQRAVDLNPGDVTARLYLATALMSQYIPGAESPENLDLAAKAETEFRRVLDLKPNDTTALASLASLMYQQAQGMPDPENKMRKLDESASWYDKLITVDPRNKEAHYSLGVIDWVKWYAAWTQTRANLGMKPGDPGPIAGPARLELKERYSERIEHGIASLEKALEIDPQYDDAMAYMNLLIRERADLADSPEQYRREIEEADQWVEKALMTKRMKAQGEASRAVPPSAPDRVRVRAQAQDMILTRKVDPVYPPLARQARIQGTVRFTAMIDRDGHVQNLQLVSGHPLLVGAAREAAAQWLYKPTFLNGSPVEVVTQLDVNFTLR